MEYHVSWFLKSSCFETFGDGNYGLFLSQKVDGEMIFIDYWEVLVLNFLEIGNTVFFWAKELIERWYLLITEKYMFWTFPKWNIRSLCNPKSWRKMIFTSYWESIPLNFSVMRNTVIFRSKNWWKDDSYLVFFSFPSYFRIWKYDFSCSVISSYL